MMYPIIRRIAVATACAMALVLYSPITARVQAQVQDFPSTTFELPSVGDRPDSKPNLRKMFKTYKPNPVKYPIPRTKFDGKPDFNNVYWAGGDVAPPKVPIESLYRPETRAFREREDVVKWKNGYDNNVFHCIPRTPVGASTGPNGALQLVYIPGLFLMLDEEDGHFRVIPVVDGPPKHNPSARRSYMGDSVGYWEGDTLVVDVTNFNGEPWLADSPRGDNPPLKTSDALHIVERWTLSDGKTLDYQATVEDPKMLTAKWTAPVVRRVPAGYDMIAETHCQEQPDLAQREDAAVEFRKEHGLPVDARKVPVAPDVAGEEQPTPSKKAPAAPKGNVAK